MNQMKSPRPVVCVAIAMTLTALAPPDLPDFFGPFRHWKLASGFAASPHDCLNAAGVC